MNKKIVSLELCALLLAFNFPVEAQQPKAYRIGYLSGRGSSPPREFVQALHNIGYVEGKNITIDHRFANSKRERVPDLAAEMVPLKMDIIAEGTGTTSAAKKATTTIPIVIKVSTDPVGTGLIASLARPGGNITGLSSLTSELNSKRLEILKEAVPKLDRVGFLRAPIAAIARDLQLKEIRPAAQALKLKLEEIDTQTDANGLESAFQTAKQKQVNAIMTMSTTAFLAERKRIAELSGKYRFPAIYPQKEYVDAGGLMSYGTDNADLYRRSAVYVDKILKGAKPADLPVQQATKFEFIINLKAAKQIGLTIPVRVLERANQVIQ